MITVLHRGGYAQMITILHRGGVSRDPQKWLRNMCTTPHCWNILVEYLNIEIFKWKPFGLPAAFQECLAKMGVQQGKDEVRTMDKWVGPQISNIVNLSTSCQWRYKKKLKKVVPLITLYSFQGRCHQTDTGELVNALFERMHIKQPLKLRCGESSS